MGRWGLGLSALLLASTCMTGLAHAQSVAQPPPRSAIDGNNVDLFTGSYQVLGARLTIGDAKLGGMTYENRYSSGLDRWKDNLSGSITLNANLYTVSFGMSSEKFNGVLNSVEGRGSTLTYNSTNQTYTYKTASGVTAIFSKSVGNSGLALARVTSVDYGDGDIRTYAYKPVEYCYETPQTQICENAYYVTSVRSNRGFQIKYIYANATDIEPSSVIGINAAEEYCDDAANCTVSPSWPRINYTYGARLASALDNAGRGMSFTYVSGYGLLNHVQSTAGTAVSIGYTAGKVSSVANGAGTWSYAYSDASGIRTTTATDPLGHARVVTSKSSVALTDANALGQTVTNTYDASNRLTKALYPEGNSINFVYDARGNVTERREMAKPGTGLADIVTTAGYDATCANPKTCNQPNWTRDAFARQTDYTYDAAHGGALTVTAPAPTSGAVRPQTRYSYVQVPTYAKNSAGTLVQTGSIWSLSGISSCAVNAACTGAAEEAKVAFSYAGSNNGLPTVVTRSSGDGVWVAAITNTYDSQGNVRTVDGPLPGAADTTRYFYDSSRLRTGVIGPDPDGGGGLRNRAERYTYDADGRVSMLEQGAASGQSDTDWANFAAFTAQLATYDAMGRLIQKSLFSWSATQAVTQYSYDAASRLTCTAQRMNPAAFGTLPASACSLGTPGTDGPDRITYSTYDNVNRLLKVTAGYGTAVPRDEGVLTYSSNGQMQTAADGKGNVTTYEYDGFDRLTKTRYPNTSGGGSSTTDFESYAYDAVGNVTQANRRGAVTNYAYDALGRLTYKDSTPGWYYYDNLNRPTYTYSGTAADKVIAHYYDGLGRPSTTYDYRGGTWYPTTTNYDLAGRLVQLQWQDGFYVNYDYDLAGEVTGIRESGSVAQLALYTYDDLGRRVAAYRGNTSTAYGYDAASRLSSLTLDLAGTAQDETYTYGYNAAGQIKSRTSSNDAYLWTGGTTVNRAYAINGLNQPTTSGGLALSYDARGNLTGDGATGFAYDSDNRLTSASGASSPTLTYDPLGRLGQVTGSAITQFVYAGSDLIAELDAGNNVLRRYVPGPGTDEPLLWYEGAGAADRRFLLPDERGSIVAVTNGSGVATAINAYDEYGVPKAGNQGRYQYTGQTFISELGVYNYKARMYSPTLGRFMQTDPIGYSDGINWYRYVGNDPVNATDPTGLQERTELDPIFVPGHVPVGGGIGGSLSGPRNYNTTAIVGDAVSTLIVTGARAKKKNDTSAGQRDEPTEVEEITVEAACAVAKFLPGNRIRLGADGAVGLGPLFDAGIGVSLEDSGRVVFDVYGGYGGGLALIGGEVLLSTTVPRRTAPAASQRGCPFRARGSWFQRG